MNHDGSECSPSRIDYPIHDEQNDTSNTYRVLEMSALFQCGCTFRLEHRRGGELPRYPGEERILLFRSDRAGAIAKIVFSSSNVNQDKQEFGTSICRGKAVIHVLDVKVDHRGKDFGGLLFTEAKSALLQRYEIVDCQLEAEEDSRRHNRLLSFYQRLGCEVKPMVKLQFINNNDGETYRRIPMQCCFLRPAAHSSLVDTDFMPIKLMQSNGRRPNLDQLGCPSGKDTSRSAEWLIRDAGLGRIQIQTTRGQYLVMDAWGQCSLSTQGEGSCLFRILQANDQHYKKVNGIYMQSIAGPFLTIDCETLAFSKEPSSWVPDSTMMSLTCRREASPLRKHNRTFWLKQSASYVQAMTRRYLKFDLRVMSLLQALNLLQSIPFSRLTNVSISHLSMRTFSFRAAEAARIEGLPDWVQLIALIHELGCVLEIIDSQMFSKCEHRDLDWTRTARSHTLGCPASTFASVSEFRILNADEFCCAVSSSRGINEQNSAFKKVLFPWTGQEYLFHMLQHNDALIPNEGLCILRYFPLVDWHTHNAYIDLASEEDESLKPFVTDFYSLRQNVLRRCNREMSDSECDKLWDGHYCQIAAKYNLLGPLKW